MNKVIYPGSFDPPTNGHLDLIVRASRIFDNVIVAVLANPNKKTFFSIDDRVKMLNKIVETKSLKSKVKVEKFDGLLIDYLADKQCYVVLRGLRALSDFEYEFQMVLANRSMLPYMETIYMMPDFKWSFISSSLVKEILVFGGDISKFVPKEIIPLIKKKYSK
ncbi:MAG: pantetheine-phosphate adenylyltransferase [Endomicrobia bacterium]|nr:pantetheine-phosphate adenylyltransferase [Endomicrobiia bacterium]